MEEREPRGRGTRIVGTVLVLAFLGTIIWAVAQDRDDDGATTVDDRIDDALQEQIDEANGVFDEDTDVTLDDTPVIPPDVVVPPLAPRPDVQEYTLTVHTDGCGVIRTALPPELEADGLTWVVKDADGFQVLGRNALGEDRYRYFRPGTYTVVLEAYGTDSYMEVSNTVTISC